MPRQKAMANHSLLTAALEGLELQKQRLDEQIREVRAMLGQRGPGRPRASAAPAMAESSDEGAGAPKAARKRRKLSAAARKRIAEAQRKRWENYRKAGKKEA
ncbi:MAG: hypothetical protein SFV54_12020 [Bryobacteraceae bacterium]|nr:hypothetical protein [Bryobacteraceae bacterium]